MSIDRLADRPQIYPRERYLHIVRTALLAQEYLFARQAILKWLAVFPGDLAAGLYYAQALVGEGRIQQAYPILDGLCVADPEYLEAAETLLLTKSPAEETLQAHVFALTGQPMDEEVLAPWSRPVWMARQALGQGDLVQAEAAIRLALGQDDLVPLAGITHLHFLARRAEIDLEARRKAAERYHRLWPDCLACMLYLADWSMESGDAHQAVALLHQAAARDVSGQVSRRLWGERHPYRSLWPEDLELSLDMQVPAGVAAGLGWNRLQDGGSVPPAPDTRLYEEVMPWVEPVTEEAAPVEELDLPSEEPCPDQSLAEEAALAAAVPQVPEEPEPLQMHGLVPAVREALIAFASLSQVSDQIAEEPEPEGRAGPAVMPSRPCPPPRSEELLSISQELERLATRMKLPGITHLDGRYPVYVIFSMRNSLEAIYGSQEADALVIEMKRLVETVRRRRGWSARLFLADDASCTEPLGIQPAWPGDPWGLKLALADLDAALSHRGERIGAVLIVGGPEIVPFHQLPNPVDDQDVDVPSDNPYATCDKNYFVPEWPVGRLPGGSGGSAALLLKALRSIRAQHAQQARWLGPGRRLRGMADLWRSGRSRKRANFGYTAAVWQRAASSVFKPIGKPKAMHVSPPLGIIPESQAEHGDVPLPAGLLGYFNLHGLVDAAEWYGQRDPLDSHSESDYPIALRPQDIEDCQKSRCKIPQVVFSEACYGAHIQGKTAEEAISLKFLEAGSLAVVGSTCMAYGSIGAPLIAADLLGQSFWRLLQQGMAAGEALRQAKLCLANEMQQRQGYLDGEDQKTIVSFVLYGDPLAQPIVNGRSAKSARYLVKPLTEVKTICDRAEFSVTDQAIPAPVMASVRRAVARYLPGMSGANLALTHERECCDGYGHACPTSQLGEVPASASPLNQDGNQADKAGRRSKHGPRSGQRGPRSLVTLSKQVESPVGVHAQYARLTLDEAGKLVKLVVSR